MLLGGLVKEIAANDLYLLPVFPFDGISYSSFSNSLNSMDIISLCDTLCEMGWKTPCYYWGIRCGIKKSLHKDVERADSMLSGFQLQDFR